MYNHNKAQQSKNRVHISWDILYNLYEAKHLKIFIARDRKMVMFSPGVFVCWLLFFRMI